MKLVEQGFKTLSMLRTAATTCRQNNGIKILFAISCLRSRAIATSTTQFGPALLQSCLVNRPPPILKNSITRNMSTSPNTDAYDNLADATSVRVAALELSKHESGAKIDRLYSQTKTLQNLSLEDRLQLVNEIMERLPSLGKGQWVEYDLAVAKLAPGVPPNTFMDSGSSSPDKSRAVLPSHVKKSGALNRMITGFLISTALRSIKKHLEYQIAIGKAGSEKVRIRPPPLLRKVRNENIGGRDMKIHGPIEAFPLFHKFEVWACADASESNNAIDGDEDGDDGDNGITVVLGAGNQSLITFWDAIEILFTPPYRPVLLKHHPLRSHLFPVFSELFAPLIERGFVHQVVDDGIPETTAILRNPKVKHVKMTGGLAGALQIEKNLAESRPHLSKKEIEDMFTTELGCVTPWIFAPGHYTKWELRNAAKHIAISKKYYAGCNCVNAQAVILPSGWKQKDEFKDILLEIFGKTTTDPLYYPGSVEKVRAIVSHYGGAESDRVRQIPGPNVDRVLDEDDADFEQPYIIDCGTFGEDDYDNHALLNEAFGPLLAIVELPAGNYGDSRYLLDHAVPFVNNKDNIFGSLSCSLIYPKKQKTDIVIREATGALNYGCVAHNTWSAYAYFSMGHGGLWGGSKFEPNGQSGRGFCGNLLHIENVEKMVVYSRSLAFPIPVQKDFLPPSFLLNSATAVFLAKSSWHFIGNALKPVFRPFTSCKK